jgi:RNA polymerase sigma-70 factor, ECF subfamily
MTWLEGAIAGSGRAGGTVHDASNETDEARWRRLTTGGMRRCYRLAGLILGNGADAEDAIGDALLRAWRQLPSLRDDDRFEAWFDRIVVNVCRDRLRRRRLVRFVPLPDEPSIAPGDPFRAVIERDALLRAADGLGVDERTVLVLHYWADLTLDEVARRMGIPVGTVKTRLHRALQTVGARLGEPGGER